MRVPEMSLKHQRKHGYYCVHGYISVHWNYCVYGYLCVHGYYSVHGYLCVYGYYCIYEYYHVLFCYTPPPKKKYAQGLGPENMDIIVFWGAKENRSSCWFFFPKFWYAKDLTVVRGPSSINQENWIWVFSAIHFVDLLQNIRIIQNLTQNLTEVERNCWQI